MSTVLILPTSPAPQSLPRGHRLLGALARRLRAWAAGPDRAAADLFELADRYEATQPSFAADLRAAARLQAGRTD